MEPDQSKLVAAQPSGTLRSGRVRWLAVPIILGIFSLLTVGYLNTFTPVKVIDGAKVYDLRTHQTTVEGVLREVGLNLQPEDVVLPNVVTALNRNDVVTVRRAKLVKVVVDGTEPKWVRTQRDSGREVLADMGFPVSVNDSLTVNGIFEDKLVVPPTASGNVPSIPPEIGFRSAVSITVIEDGGPLATLKTSARTVGEGLLQAGVIIYLADDVKPAPGELIAPNTSIAIQRAKPVSIWVDGRQVRTRTLRNRVSDVLAEMNIVLFEQDYTKPELDAPVTPNTEIRVVRIKREVQIQQQFIPFETQWQPDDVLELDSQILAQDGAPGVQEQRSMVTFEDGLEVNRQLIVDFTPREPLPRVYKYGTNIVLRPLDTPAGQVQYWRKIRMLATSYSASTAGVSRDKACTARRAAARQCDLASSLSILAS